MKKFIILIVLSCIVLTVVLVVIYRAKMVAQPKIVTAVHIGFDNGGIAGKKILTAPLVTNPAVSIGKSNDNLAGKEKKENDQEGRLKIEKRMTDEPINDIYIPKDLGECFIELDKLLKESDKKEMQALPKREDMIKYHMGLGMWIRNSWGLWGGSRLQKYFKDKGIEHPDSMSGIILDYYYDCLHGKKETWKDWEKHPKAY
jgi:hypothetical protein